MLVPTTLLVNEAVGAAAEQAKLTAGVGSALFYGAADVLAWGIGRWARRHHRQVDTLQVEHTLEVQEQRAEAENAVSAERLRIARELHDIVAHSVTIMVLHAAGAKRVVDTDPARAKESLTTIEESGQQAMGELRRLLELLREDESELLRSGSPLPGLAQLSTTIQSVRGSGVAVTLDVSGTPRRLDTSTDLAAFRLVQEALTNVTKHRGAGAHATVSIEWGAEKLTVAVEDDGQGTSDLSVRDVHRKRAGRAAGADRRRRRRLRGRPDRSRRVPGRRPVAAVRAGRRRRPRRHPGPTQRGYAPALDGASAARPGRAADGGDPVGQGRPVIRVVLIDDEPIVRSGIAMLLSGEPDIEVIADVDGGPAAVDLVVSRRPDVVITDVRMPVMDGVETTRQIVARTAGSDERQVRGAGADHLSRRPGRLLPRSGPVRPGSS